MPESPKKCDCWQCSLDIFKIMTSPEPWIFSAARPRTRNDRLHQD
jgi:hypothetical protein